MALCAFRKVAFDGIRHPLRRGVKHEPKSAIEGFVHEPGGFRPVRTAAQRLPQFDVAQSRSQCAANSLGNANQALSNSRNRPSTRR